MRDERQRSIEHLVTEIFTCLELSPHFPVDIKKAVQRLGGRIERLDLERNPRGIIAREDHRSFTLKVPQQLSAEQRRYELAHLTGHLFLHMGYILDDERWLNEPEYKDSPTYRYGHDHEERDADWFAGAFVMPEGSFREVATQHYQLTDIAEVFGVPPPLAKLRGQYLDLFPWE